MSGPVILWTSRDGTKMIALDRVTHVDASLDVAARTVATADVDPNGLPSTIDVYTMTAHVVIIRDSDCDTFLAQWRDYHEIIVSGGRTPKGPS